MSSAKSQLPVLIVGAGPTGQMLALSLARHGIQTEIVDKAPGRSSTSRALGLQARTLEMFDTFGISGPFLASGLRVKRGVMFQGNKELVRMDFAGIPSRHPYVLILPQTETERLLDTELEKHGVNIQREVEFRSLIDKEDCMIATLSDRGGSREIEARFVVGCDGAHSSVRHALNIDFPGEPYPQFFGLADVHATPRFPDNEIHTHIHPEGLTVFFPLPGGMIRIIAELEESHTSSGITLEELERVVQKRVDPSLRFQSCSWITAFRTHRRKATRFRQGNAFLAGDAAHIHSPAGGQGMNTGLQDAANLGWKIAAVLQGKAPAQLLESYHTERSSIAAHVLATSDRMMKLGSSHSVLAATLRQEVMPRISRSAWFQKYAPSEIAQLFHHYRTGHHAKLWPQTSNPSAGDRFPDLQVMSAGGGRVSLQLLSDPTEFHLLLFVASPASFGPFSLGEAERCASAAQSDFGKNLRITFVGRSITKEARPNILVDADGLATNALGFGEGGMCLNRPDGVIAVLRHDFDWPAARLATLAFWTGL